MQQDIPSVVVSPRIQTDSCQYNHVDGRTMSSYEMAATRCNNNKFISKDRFQFHLTVYITFLISEKYKNTVDY